MTLDPRSSRVRGDRNRLQKEILCAGNRRQGEEGGKGEFLLSHDASARQVSITPRCPDTFTLLVSPGVNVSGHVTDGYDAVSEKIPGRFHKADGPRRNPSRPPAPLTKPTSRVTTANGQSDTSRSRFPSLHQVIALIFSHIRPPARGDVFTKQKLVD
ncbi:hypothetical protein BaRGS_00008464 [Batillaria attramentaria]|uniref:Uncharacterized protein n=1 Tax=Batillaria attramentaria TaxID=370345 RepID=A0ABD0LLX8_9CAEN